MLDDQSSQIRASLCRSWPQKFAQHRKFSRHDFYDLTPRLAPETPSSEKAVSPEELIKSINYGTTFTGVTFASPSHLKPDLPDQIRSSLCCQQGAATINQVFMQAIQYLKKEQLIVCDAGRGTAGLINYDIIYIVPAPISGFNNFSHAFPAKEEPQFGYYFLYYEYPLRYEMNENDTNPNLGDLETIWNSSASHLSHEQATQGGYNVVVACLPKGDIGNSSLAIIAIGEGVQKVVSYYPTVYTCINSVLSRLEYGEFLKGWNKEWGSLRIPSFHARVGQLFDRDYVWVVTQTMVSFKKLAFWAMHILLIYRIYPGFWGRILGLLHELIF